MPRTITKTVYEYHELSERAKDRVKQWLNESGGPEDYDFVIEDFKIVAEMFGFQLRVTGGANNLRESVYWTSNYGWSAGFVAEWAFPDMSVTEALSQHMGEGDPLHKDAAIFEAALAKFKMAHAEAITAGNITALVSGTENGYKNIEYYDPENYTNADGVEFTEDEKERMVADYNELFNAVEQAAKDLNHWLASNLRAEEESRWEDDYVKDTCEANEYLFDEDGCIVR